MLTKLWGLRWWMMGLLMLGSIINYLTRATLAVAAPSVLKDLNIGPIATAGHMHTMMAFPGQVLMEYSQGERPVPYMPEFLECRNGKVWPNDRPGLGVSVDEKQLTLVETMTEGAQGITHRRPDGSLTHW